MKINPLLVFFFIIGLTIISCKDEDFIEEIDPPQEQDDRKDDNEVSFNSSSDFFDLFYISKNHPLLQRNNGSTSRNLVDSNFFDPNMVLSEDSILSDVYNALLEEEASRPFVDELSEITGFPAWDFNIKGVLSNKNYVLIPMLNLQDDSTRSILTVSKEDSEYKYAVWYRDYVNLFTHYRADSMSFDVQIMKDAFSWFDSYLFEDPSSVSGNRNEIDNNSMVDGNRSLDCYSMETITITVPNGCQPLAASNPSDNSSEFPNSSRGTSRGDCLEIEPAVWNPVARCFICFISVPITFIVAEDCSIPPGGGTGTGGPWWPTDIDGNPAGTGPNFDNDGNIFNDGVEDVDLWNDVNSVALGDLTWGTGGTNYLNEKARYQFRQNQRYIKLTDYVQDNNIVDYTPEELMDVVPDLCLDAPDFNECAEINILWHHNEVNTDNLFYNPEYWQDPNLVVAPVALPSWDDLNNGYPRDANGEILRGAEALYGLFVGENELYNLWLQYKDNVGVLDNVCAFILSIALNEAGVAIPDVPDQTFSDGNGGNYFVNAKAMTDWMIRAFGSDTAPNINPNYTYFEDGVNLPGNPDAAMGDKKGIYALEIELGALGGASGHVDSWNGNWCNGSCTWRNMFGVHFWELE